MVWVRSSLLVSLASYIVAVARPHYWTKFVQPYTTIVGSLLKGINLHYSRLCLIGIWLIGTPRLIGTIVLYKTKGKWLIGTSSDHRIIGTKILHILCSN